MAVGTKKGMGKRIILPLLLILVSVAILATFSGVYAKYVKTLHKQQGLVTSQVMYFESDYLRAEGAEYTISGDSVTFELRNYPDALRVSELPVTYEVSVTGGATIKINSDAVTAGEFAANGMQQTATVEISGLQRGQTYTVTATGKNGFVRTLSATFNVQAAETQVFKRVEQTEHYVLLTVWTQDVSAVSATIEFPEGLLPDNTDPLMKDVTANSRNFEDKDSFATPYSSRTYRFFISNTDTTKYSADSFTVTVGDKTAVKETN